MTSQLRANIENTFECMTFDFRTAVLGSRWLLIVIVKAEVNRKTLKKQVAKMDEFEDWVGALSGKIAQITTEGVIEIEGAGLQVFEKKKKEPKPDNDQQSTAA